MNNFLQQIIRGYTWKIKLWNEAIFEWWTPEKVSRKEAKQKLLEIANRGEYFSRKEGLYRDCSKDIISIWETKQNKNM